VGYKLKKIIGSIVATVGVIMPSVIVIMAIASILSNFADIPAVQHAFAGIRIAVGALIVRSVIKLTKSNVKNLFQVVLCIASFIVVAFLGQSPVYVVIGAGIFGFAYGKWGGRK
jgi:chromate transporter